MPNFTVTSSQSTLEVDSGRLNLTGGGSSVGIFNVSGTLEFSGAAYAINAGATFTGGGSVIVGGELDVNTSFTLPTLVNDDTVKVTVGTLEVQGGSTNDDTAGSGSATFNISQGATLLFDTNPFTLNGTVSFSGTGQVEVGNSGVLNVQTTTSIPIFQVDSTASVDLTSGTLTVGASGQTATNSGEIDVAGGLLRLAARSTLLNDNVIDLQQDDDGSNSISGGAAAIIDNQGTLEKSNGSGVSNVAVALSNTSNGTIDDESGTFNLSGGGDGIEQFVINGAAVEFSTSPFTIEDGSSVSGTGDFIVADEVDVDADLTISTLVNNGTVNAVVGTLEVQGGATNVIDGAGAATFNVGQSGTLEFDTDAFTVQGTVTFSGTGLTRIGGSGEFTLDSDISIQNFEVDTGAIVDGTNTLTVGVNSGQFNWYGGELDNPSTIVDSTGTMTVTGSDNKTLNGSLTSSGTLTFDNGNFVGSGLVTISNGQVNVNADVSITNFELENGTVSGSKSLTLAVNSGTFTWKGGTLAPASASIDASNGDHGTLNLDGTGSVGSGPVPTLTTTLTNYGTTNLPSLVGLYGNGVGTFVNAEGATFNLGTGGFSAFISQGLTFQNAGTFTSNSLGNGSSFEATSFDNESTGVFHLETGTDSFSGISRHWRCFLHE